MVKLKFNPTRRIEKPDEGAAHSSQTPVKSVLHIHHDESHKICHNTDIQTNLYDSVESGSLEKSQILLSKMNQGS